MLTRATARLLAVIARWRGESSSKITIDYLESAEFMWIREIQVYCYKPEIIDLQKNQTLRKQSKISTLTPFLDENGILRANGRLHNVPNEIIENNPIILEKAHYVTKLLLRHYYDKYGQNNLNIIFNEIHQRFWIVDVCNALKSIAKNCVIYKRGVKNVHLHTAV